jgi:hypothetical protein
MCFIQCLACLREIFAVDLEPGKIEQCAGAVVHMDRNIVIGAAAIAMVCNPRQEDVLRRFIEQLDGASEELRSFVRILSGMEMAIRAPSHLERVIRAVKDDPVASIKTDNYAQLRQFVGKALDLPYWGGTSLWDVAAVSGSFGCCELLGICGASLSQRGLEMALQGGDIRIINMLWNSINPSEMPALLKVIIKRGHLDILDHLLSSGPLSSIDRLVAGAQSGNLEFLLAALGEVNSYDLDELVRKKSGLLELLLMFGID